MVGTHIDLIPRAEKDENVKLWTMKVEAFKANRAHSHLYPRMGIYFVGLPKKGKQFGVHGPDGLADCMYDIAMKMEVPNGVCMNVCVCVCTCMYLVVYVHC